jgi:hypothetical protein
MVQNPKELVIMLCSDQGNMLKPKRQVSDRDKVAAAADNWMEPKSG